MSKSENSESGNFISGVRTSFWLCEMEFGWNVTLGYTSIGVTVLLLAGESFLAGESTCNVLKTEWVRDRRKSMCYCVAKFPGWVLWMGVKSNWFWMGVKSNPLIVPDIDFGNPSIKLLRSTETTLLGCGSSSRLLWCRLVWGNGIGGVFSEITWSRGDGMSYRDESFNSALSSLIFGLSFSARLSFWLWSSLHMTSRLYRLNFEAPGVRPPETFDFGVSASLILFFFWDLLFIMFSVSGRSILLVAELSRWFSF